MIRAETHPDDHAIEIYFDAEQWFTNASDENILNLAGTCASYTPDQWEHGAVVWGQDYPSDDIAMDEAESNSEIKRMFDYLAIRPDRIGFECYVHAGDAMRWLKEHRPTLYEKVEAEQHPE